jgi:hypothetical protein
VYINHHLPPFTILSFTPKHRAEKVIDRKRNGIPGVKPRGISSPPPPPPPPMFACLLVAEEEEQERPFFKQVFLVG